MAAKHRSTGTLCLTLALLLPVFVVRAATDKASCGLCLPAAPAKTVAAPTSRPTFTLTFPDKPNPHGRRNRCNDCHQPGGDPAAQSFHDHSCVECHDPQAHLREIHPTDFAGDSPKAPAFPGARLENGRSTCLTCHEINCNGATEYRVFRENRAMLRGGPWPRETDFCYQCHNRELYQPVYPHGASVDDRICWYCHDPAKGSPAAQEGMAMQPALGDLCRKCHKDVKHEREHVGRSVLDNRLKMDTASALQRFQQESGVTLPLGPGGTVACVTCHSPNPACSHGVPPAPKLLRAAKERICYACHDL